MADTTLQPMPPAHSRDVIDDVCMGTIALLRAHRGRTPSRCSARWSGGDVMVVMIDDLDWLDEEWGLELGDVIEAATGRVVSIARVIRLPSRGHSAVLATLGGPGGENRRAVLGRALSAERRARDSVARTRTLLAESARTKRENAACRAGAPVAQPPPPRI